MVFCPEIGFLRAATIESNDRVRRFFGPDLDDDLDLDRMNTLKAAFEEGVASAEGSLHTLDDFQNFITARANQLILTPARPMKIADPELDLTELLDRLVGGLRSTRARRTSPS